MQDNHNLNGGEGARAKPLSGYPLLSHGHVVQTCKDSFNIFFLGKTNVTNAEICNELYLQENANNR